MCTTLSSNRSTLVPENILAALQLFAGLSFCRFSGVGNTILKVESFKCLETQLPETNRKTSSRKKSVSKRSSSQKRKSSGTSSVRKLRTARHGTAHRSRSHGAIGETYVFECTRQGCGYRIVREEKAEVGDVRFDLKCPKCHNGEFKCLGKGDLPESLELSLPGSTLDFNSIRPVDLGSN
jgi:hypothetical protein